MSKRHKCRKGTLLHLVISCFLCGQLPPAMSYQSVLAKIKQRSTRWQHCTNMVTLSLQYFYRTQHTRVSICCSANEHSPNKTLPAPWKRLFVITVFPVLSSVSITSFRALLPFMDYMYTCLWTGSTEWRWMCFPLPGLLFKADRVALSTLMKRSCIWKEQRKALTRALRHNHDTIKIISQPLLVARKAIFTPCNRVWLSD